MTRCPFAALAAFAALSFASANAQSNLPLASLTVPPDQLPAGCTLEASDRIDRWAATNPWTGADAPVIATIRESMGAMPLMPDAPLTAREQTAFRLALARGVTEGYAALYRAADGRGAAQVYAVTLERPENTRPAGPWQTQLRDAAEFTVGRSTVVVRGKGSDCYDAIVRHVRDVTAR